MNNVVLIGRLTKEPEIRYSAGSDMAVANFTLAVERYSKKGEESKADFPRVIAFGKTATFIEKWARKGKLMAVRGRIQTGSYEKNDRTKVFTTDVVADEVRVLEWPDKEQAEPTTETRTFEQVEDDLPF